MAGLDPAIHVVPSHEPKAWIAGTSPAMTALFCPDIKHWDVLHGSEPGSERHAEAQRVVDRAVHVAARHRVADAVELEGAGLRRRRQLRAAGEQRREIGDPVIDRASAQRVEELVDRDGAVLDHDLRGA